MFAPDAKWIWLARPQRDKNSYVTFRRSFDCATKPKHAKLAITADSRYELYVNGTFVGHGPVRSWPSPWPVDEYDISHLLCSGKNSIGVLVTHFGISTFQYLHDQPGLIAQLDFDRQTIVTNEKWRCLAHDGYAWPVPRITCQQAWEEQFDARVAPGLPHEWSTPNFDDWRWLPPKELRRAGDPPHDKFEPRGIPFLTLERVEPASVRSIEIVRPASYTFALNPREFINATDKSMNHIIARMLIATTIESPAEQKVDFHQPHTRPFLKWKLNGELLDFNDMSMQKTDVGVAHATLRQGANTLIVRLPESEHHYWANLNVWTEEPVKFAPWRALGPFGGQEKHRFDEVVVPIEHLDASATIEQFESIWETAQLPADRSFVREMRPDMIASTDAYATCVSDRVDPSVQPRVENLFAMLDDNAAWTTIHPTARGAAVRVLFDFGREWIGFHEFEIDAPAGTVVDFCNFEFIQRDGRFNLNESMNNSFRYICRDGVQRYKTFLRRGLKYSWMVLRNFDRPVRVRAVRVLVSTYPQTSAGSFECSDVKLNQIWRVGVHSVRCCSEDTYTDCPTYEQTFWVGDARNEALVDLIANGDPRLSARCLKLVARSLDRSPIAESQVPSGWQNLLPTWTFLWMRWAQEHYQLDGDKDFAREMLPFLDRNVAGMRKAIDERGLFHMFAWNLFDWAAMDTPANGIVTHINCLASLALQQCAQLASELGDEEKSRDWLKFSRELAEATNKHLWSTEKQAYLDCIRANGQPSPVFSQQTQTAAYISGVAQLGGADRAERCREIVHHPPHDFVKAGSPFFMFFLLEALVREERYDVLVRTIRDYWGKQTDAGATTFWEMYHEPESDDRTGTDGAPPDPAAGGRAPHRLTRSHCHGWSAAPTFFLTQYTLGVRPLTPGYASILIAPKPAELSWAQGRVPTPRGVVECYFKSREDRFDLTVNAPAETPLRVELPWWGTVRVIQGQAKVDGDVVTASSAPLKLMVTR